MIGGIAGRLNHNGVIVEEGEVNKMLSLLGPTGAGRNTLFVDKELTLGQMSLGIDRGFENDEAPLIDGESNLAIAANACLTNREDIIDEIYDRGSRRHKMSDSALIMKAYEKWGTKCPEKFAGPFSFALWDGKNQRLFCARDHMGRYSFCYHISENGFIFGSEVKAILAAKGMEATLNPLYLTDFILALQCDAESTAFHGVSHLPAAHAMTVEGGSCKKWLYWTPGNAPDVRFTKKTDYVDAFADLLSKATANCIAEPGKVGLQTGGGLQTAAIASTVSHILKERGERLFGVSYVLRPGYDGPLQDEREYTDELASLHDLDLKYVWQGPSFPHPFAPDVEDRFYYLDSPEANAFGHDHYAVYGAMKDSGVKMILTPGGPLFGHMPLTMREISQQRRASRAGLLKTRVTGMVTDFLSDSQYNKLLRFSGRGGAINDRINLFDNDLSRRLDLRERVWANLQNLPGRGRSRASLRDNLVQIIENRIGLGKKYMSHKERVYECSFHAPFMDRRLIEFAVGIASRPADWGGDFRELLRESLQGKAPQKILDRKSGTSYPVDISERKTGAKGDILQALSAIPAGDEVWEYVDREKAGALASLTSPHLDNYKHWFTQGPHILVRIIMLQRFLPMVNNGRFEGPDNTIAPHFTGV